jgi:hypothetical protein
MLWVGENRIAPLAGEVRKLYDDFAVKKCGKVGCPPNFNRLTVSWYLNEPANGSQPNVYCDKETYEFFALKDISPDEELTVVYSTYSDTT